MSAQSVKETWETYIASYDNNKPGSTTVRMDLINSTPIKDYNFVLVTGIKYESNRQDGFPENKTFEKLSKVNNKLIKLLNNCCSNIIVGSFTYEFERLEYFYLKTDKGIKQKIEKLYKTKFPNDKYYVNIKEDKNWKYYTDFLYPNQETINYIADAKVVKKLVESGDKLTKERRVDHWIYFSNKADLNSFKKKIIELKFNIEPSMKKDSLQPYEIRIWRTDKVDLNSINSITNQLRKLSERFNGDYDGWETSVETE